MLDWNTLGIISTVATSSLGLGYYISNKFSNIEKSLTQQLTDHKEEDEEKFHDHALRLQRLELSEFSVTHSGKNPDKFDYLGLDQSPSYK